MADIGIGFGKFMEGFMTGDRFKSEKSRREREDKMLADQDKLRDSQKAAFQAAKDARAKDIQGKVVPLDKLGGFGYGDQFFNTREDAAKAAEGDAKPLMDYYMNVSVPRIRDSLLEAGEIEKARIYDQWIQQEATQKGMKSWANAVVAAQRNDAEGFAKNLVDAYNNEEYFGDGATVDSYKVLKKNGKPSGIELVIKDANGNKTTQQFNDLEEVYRTGMAFMEPSAVIQYGMQQIEAAQQARAEAAKTQAQYGKEIAVEDYRQRGRLQLADRNSENRIRELQSKQTETGSKAVAEAEAMAKALVANGIPQEQVQQMYPQLLGVYRASQSPQDRLQAIYEGLESARSFDPEWRSLTPEQKLLEAKKLMDAQQKILMQNDGNGAATQQQGRRIPMFGPNGQYYVGG